MFLVAAFVTTATLADAGDSNAGKTLFKKCMACHSPDAGVIKVGPSLHGIVGRRSAGMEKFQYSPAMKGLNKVWDESELDVYLTNPRAFVPNTKMIFPGFKDPADRQNLIAYLATLK